MAKKYEAMGLVVPTDGWVVWNHLKGSGPTHDFSHFLAVSILLWSLLTE